jgi:hypothetical protein
MNRTAEFRSFYEKELQPELKKLESKRKSIILQMRLVILIGIILVPTAAIGMFKVIEEVWVIFLFIPIFALIGLLFYIIYESLYRNTTFYKDYKRNIIKRIITEIDPSLHYDNRLYVNISDFFRSNFYPKKTVKYDGDDHISGQFDNVEVEFSELEVEYKNKADSTDGSNTMFKGIFFVAKIPNTFIADLVIETRKTGVIRPGELDVKNNPAFNDSFIAWVPNANEKEAAVELLSEELMNSLNSFHAVIPNSIKISFGYDKLFVAVEHSKSLFEPALWENCENFDDVLKHYYNLYYPMSIISHLTTHHELNFGKDSK